MFCSNCGRPIEVTDKFCPHCGAAVAERLQNAANTQSPVLTAGKPAKRKRNAIMIACAALVVCVSIAVLLLTPGKATTDYWPKSAPDKGTVETALWEFDVDDIFEAEDNLSIISVSPSGKYILAADQITMNIAESLAAGIPNRLGRLPDRLYVFANENGDYRVENSIEINDTEFSSTIGVCRDDSVAWSGDETRVLITVGLIDSRAYIRTTHSNIYLVDREKQTYENLTNDDSRHNLLPEWADNDNIRFIRIDMEYNWETVLMEMNVKTSSQKTLADLADDTDGSAGIVMDYAIHGDTVYYSREFGLLEFSGFYSASFNGNARSPKELLSAMELREDLHPYSYIISTVQVSADGRWACLSVLDSRIMSRDIPLVDFDVTIILGIDATQEEKEQLREKLGLGDPTRFDPNSSQSYITGEPWIPCHNVILYDLENNKIVDPFTDSALRPDAAIVTAATFAPDGKSLVCAVFGDGGAWYMDDYNKTTLYQIKLDDGSFDAVRIFKTDVQQVPDRIAWLDNNSILLNPYLGIPPRYPVQIVTPAAFKRFGV